ncbi:MAG: bifunctional 3,4-dihydroxy-2-butanone 4-phosphate synthase/GTP cyclohydrolase II [Gammaproteobacteria bacterium RIFCSPHIGHO2_12_FULL_45_9]|nr:MAG: bifunctional 3,4-dihydroxy-2-butanone 4-phosphate synthase/GTP cyclohydrolase II [Gammaproteobacteria bacterium RIFCSPHIGHO2_12_FULL_45_9]
MSKVEQALDALRSGRMVLLSDDTTRENEGDLILAAEHVTPEAINFMAQYGRGLICLAMTGADFERLDIPLMTRRNRSPHQTAFGVSLEAAQGVATGISAADRATTIRVVLDPKSGPDDIVMPGHMFPLRAHPCGVLGRRGHTEGSVDLARWAGLKPAAVLCEVMNADGSMARGAELAAFAKQHDLVLVTMPEIVAYAETQGVPPAALVPLKPVAEAELPIDLGFTCHIAVFRDTLQDTEHVALTVPVSQDTVPLVRLHSECFSGDVCGSKRCDCGPQWRHALARLGQEGGALLYLRQEGRGIGLIHKIRAYALQEQGLDTVEANVQLGFAPDLRDYELAARMLLGLGLTRIRLMTNNPLKIEALHNAGIEVVERIPIEMSAHPENRSYLETKRDKLGHMMQQLEKRKV